jgi:hypothetical protein
MTTFKLLAELRDAGVILTADGDQLAFDAPTDVMTTTRLEMMASRKVELLALLRGAVHRRLLQVAATWPQNWRNYWRDRAVVYSQSGQVTPDEADERAFHDLLSHVLAGHGVLYEPYSVSTAEWLGTALHQCIQENDHA